MPVLHRPVPAPVHPGLHGRARGPALPAALAAVWEFLIAAGVVGDPPRRFRPAPGG
ncbi:hypothetical protein [Saccharopolyspora rosea]|uniref:hypothetical protein n=1 Tax=Saccharopolyspora rosea TaxID=524884 RepID=UPI0021D82B6E|nr:hypothetical protein [Saccharopolyspora rosea]